MEVKDYVTGQWSLVALAGPANRQGRIAADIIAGPVDELPRHTGHLIIGLFGGTSCQHRRQRKNLKRLGEQDYEECPLYPNSHAGYYPGAKYLAMKIIFRKSDGRLLGAQAVGEDGVDKRIDAFAMAIQLQATIYDLEEAKLCYSPQFGSAKAPVNFAGMVAADVLHGDMPLTHWNSTNGGLLLDVRYPQELAVEHVPGALNIPLPQLRSRLEELPHGTRDPGDLPLWQHAPTMPRAFYCRTNSMPASYQGACCHAQFSQSRQDKRRCKADTHNCVNNRLSLRPDLIRYRHHRRSGEKQTDYEGR